ncbi:hypothetical protein EDC01DRAFT_510851 [Geopyxis carbonaria]|nr:hypothetical protein EDC01DRAFT_510851 [Geopyxis carbonaria]
MNNSDEQQRWRTQGQNQQRPQGQRRNGPRDGYSGQGYSSNQGNSNANNGAWGARNNNGMNHHQQQQHQQQSNNGPVETHIPVNGFNSRELEEMLNRGYEANMNAYRAAPESEKPVLYKSSDQGWSTPKGGAWGTKVNTMANGANFLVQLKKSQVALPSSKD